MKNIIVVIDRYPILRTGLVHFLKDELDDVWILGYENIEVFQQIHPYLKPDVIISGLSQCDQWTNQELILQTQGFYDLRTVIFYDETTDFSMVRHYFRLGVQHYLSKQSDLEELKTCIIEVLTVNHSGSQTSSQRPDVRNGYNQTFFSPNL